MSSDERSELAALRRDKRRLEMENEIFRSATSIVIERHVHAVLVTVRSWPRV